MPIKDSVVFNGLRNDLKVQGTHVVGLLVAFMGTDMAKGAPGERTQPDAVVKQSWEALEAGVSAVRASAVTRQLELGLAAPQTAYLGEPYVAASPADKETVF